MKNQTFNHAETIVINVYEVGNRDDEFETLAFEVFSSETANELCDSKVTDLCCLFLRMLADITGLEAAQEIVGKRCLDGWKKQVKE